jgi:hypothetical protein
MSFEIIFLVNIFDYIELNKKIFGLIYSKIIPDAEKNKTAKRKGTLR